MSNVGIRGNWPIPDDEFQGGSNITGGVPTITGNAGGGAEISLDGTTQESTWSAIDGGTPINGSTAGNDEFVVVKEI